MLKYSLSQAMWHLVSCVKQYFHINLRLNFTTESDDTVDNSGQIEPAINKKHLKFLANKSRSNSTVCFNQQLAQSVVAITAETNTVNSELDTEKVNIVSAVRFCDSIRLNRQSILKLVQDNLIKIQSSLLTSSSESLQDFCKFDDRASSLCWHSLNCAFHLCWSNTSQR